jgi:serine/threonine-protein kinase
MGAVYGGMHVGLGEPVAIKVLRRMFASTPELRERFRREAVALARLRHPAIVSVLDFGEHEGELFLIMELVRGRSLDALLDESPILAIPFVGAVFGQLLEVLDIAHAAGIVHRDLKPSNVMVMNEERIKLLDFGLVHLPGASKETLTKAGVAQGTPPYMSPEQCEGNDVGPASDIYSLGIMLYECVVGEMPFRGPGAGQLMAQHLFTQPAPFGGRGVAPPALEDLVMRALAKRAERRQTPREMRAELASIIAGTDPLTIAAASAGERIRLAGVSRSARSITGRPPKPAVSSQSEKASIELRVLDPDRAASLRSALSVSGIHAVVRAADTDGEAAGVVVVSATDGLDVLREAAQGTIPVLVVDVRDIADTRECIRAGASDMAMAGTPDSELASRVHRLLRRGR